jgi:small GTP-binding protein
MSKSLKIHFIGNKYVGKSSIIWRFNNKTDSPVYPNYLPATYDQIIKTIQFRGQEYVLEIVDQYGGVEDLENIHMLGYHNVDIFLICFSIEDSMSYDSVQTKLVPELTMYCKDPVYILVGNKIDLRDHPETIQYPYYSHQENPITKEQGETLARKIGASNYCECSALNNIGIQEVFDIAITVATENQSRRASEKSCILI